MNPSVLKIRFAAIVMLNVALISLVSERSVDATPPAPPISFSDQIAAILDDHCVSCHGPKKAEGAFRADTFEWLSQPGDSGAQPVVAGDDSDSELLRRLISDDPAERMPLDAEPLSKVEVELVRQWILDGGKDDGASAHLPVSILRPAIVYPASPKIYPASLPVTGLTYSPGGTQLLVSGYHEILVFDAVSGAIVRRIGNMPERIHSILAPAGVDWIAVAGGTAGKLGEVRIVDWQSGNVSRVVARTSDVTLDLGLSPDQKIMAVCGADGLIRLIDTHSWEEIRQIASHADWVQGIAWSPDGTKLASASRDKTAKVFAVESGELLATFAGHTAAVRGIVFHGDGAEVFSAGTDGRLMRWKVDGAAKVAEMPCGGEVNRIQWAAGSVWVTSADRKLRQFSSETNQVLRTFEGAEDWILSVATNPSVTHVAAGAFDGNIRVWEVALGSEVWNRTAEPDQAAGKSETVAGN